MAGSVLLQSALGVHFLPEHASSEGSSTRLSLHNTVGMPHIIQRSLKASQAHRTHHRGAFFHKCSVDALHSLFVICNETDVSKDLHTVKMSPEASPSTYGSLARSQAMIVGSSLYSTPVMVLRLLIIFFT